MRYELVTDIQKVERLISEINRIHQEYSKDYFDTGKVAKVIIESGLVDTVYLYDNTTAFQLIAIESR